MTTILTRKYSEWEKIGLSFVIVLLIFRILFSSDSWLVILKSTFTIYWLFIFPGIGITYLFRSLTFIERLAVSVAISAAIIGSLSYYLGILGVHVKYSAFVLPAIFSAISGLLIIKTRTKDTGTNTDKNTDLTDLKQVDKNTP